MNQRSRMIMVEHHPARQNADEPHQQHLAQQQHGMARQSDIEAAVHQQHGGKGEQAGDTGVDQQATPLDADFRPVEADGGGREHDRERQHRGEVGGAERGRLRCADTLCLGQNRERTRQRQRPVNDQERQCQLAQPQHDHFERHQASQDARHACLPRRVPSSPRARAGCGRHQSVNPPYRRPDRFAGLTCIGLRRFVQNSIGIVCKQQRSICSRQSTVMFEAINISLFAVITSNGTARKEK